MVDRQATSNDLPAEMARMHWPNAGTYRPSSPWTRKWTIDHAWS